MRLQSHLVGWVIFEALVECHDIFILGKCPIKWKQCPDMTMAVDWDIKHQFKQTSTGLCHTVKCMFQSVFQVHVLVDVSSMFHGMLQVHVS